MFEGLKPCPHRRVDDNGHILCGWIKSGDNQVSVNLCRGCQVPQINCQHLRAALQKTASAPITVRYATGRVEVWDDEPPSVEFKQAACAAKTMPIHSARDCSGCPLRAPHVIPQSAVQVARQNRPAAQVPVIPQATFPAAAPSVAAQPSAAAPRMQRAAEASAPRARQSAPRSRPTQAPAQQASAQSAESGAAQELIARAKRMAAHKEQERVQAAREVAAEYQAHPTAATSGKKVNRSKIILLQQWLADQISKKTEPEPAESEPDEDGVRDIVYAPVAASYAEEPGLERCVGWTD